MDKTYKINVLATVWRHWKSTFVRNKWAIIAVFLCYNLSAFFDWMMKPVYWKEVFDSLATAVSPWNAFGMVVVFSLLAWISSRIADYFIAVSEAKVIKELKDYSLRGLLFRNTAFFTSHPLGGLVAKAKRFASESEVVLDQFVFSISRSCLLVVYLLVYSYFVIPKLTLLLAVWTFLFFTASFVFSRIRTKYDLESAECDSRTTALLSDILSSVLTLRTFAAIPREFSRFQKATEMDEVKRKKAWFMSNFQWAVQATLVVVLEISVMYLAVSWVENKTETIGTAVMVQTYIVSLSMNMWNLGQSVARLRRGLTDAYEMSSTLDTIDDENPDQGRQVQIHADRGICLDGVSFRYESSTEPVIRNCSFSFESGKRYGIVGVSGSGKSTLIKCILRLHDPSKGVISIFGYDIKTIDRDIVRSWIAYVPQQQTFPSRTVREIISLGKPDVTDEEIREAAEKASCDFIWTKLPHGFDTHVGERGVKLSGGEAQRLAIAAALLKDAPIVIMDEPTSALDAETEHLIQKSIREHFHNKTLIVIAHRLSTVAILDEIVLMKDGLIVDSKSHDALIEASEEYRNMWELQTNPILV